MDAPTPIEQTDILLMLQSMGEGVVAVDGTGRFIFFNAMAERLLGRGALDLPPEQWPARYGVYLPDRRTLYPAAELPLVCALRGEAVAERELFIRNGRHPEGLFVGASAMPIRRPDGTQSGAVLVLRDISERVRMREQLERSHALAGLLETVAAAANEATRAGPALQTALKAVCTLEGWPLGFAYRCAEAGAALVLVTTWHEDAPRFAPLQALTERTRFLSGEGLPGLVLAGGTPVSSGDTQMRPSRERQRLARQAGLTSGIAFPILSGDRVLGVLEFGAEAPIPEDPQFLDVMAQLGVQLGRALEREMARERERFFASILDRVAHPIFVKDRRFRWVFLNEAFCTMVGYRCEELLGRSDYDFFPKEEADFFRKKDLEMFASERMVDIEEERITDASGRYHFLATTKVPLFGSSGEVTHLVGIIHDISQRKAAEEQSRHLAVEQAARATAEEAHRRAAFLSEASRVLAGSLVPETTLATVARLPLAMADWCIVTVAEEGHRLRVAAVARSGRNGEEAVRAALESHTLDPEALGGVAEVIRTGRAVHLPHLEGSLVATLEGHSASLPDGGPFVPISSYLCVPLRARGRTLGAMSLACTDPQHSLGAESLALAEELALRTAVALDNAALYQQSQEAIRLRDEFLQVASHELRTPLTSLKIQLQGLVRSQPPAPSAAEARLWGRLHTLQRQVDRLTMLVGTLLDVSSLMTWRLELTREPVDLAALVRDVAGQYAEELSRAGSELRLHVEGPVVGDWDELRLQQVVTNLLSNAIKFGEGRLIELSVTTEGDTAQLTVVDHGMGIPPEDVQRIFGRFERAVSSRHFGGLGLGLFVTRQIVEAHGGDIHVESEHGRGSTFVVRLPRRLPAPPPQPSPA